MNGRIVIVKLLNGDEIIGRLESISDYGFRIEDPLIISDDESARGMILLNYIPFSDQKYVDVNPNTIVCYNEASVTMVIYYEKSLRYIRNVNDLRYNKSLESAIIQLDILLDKYVDNKQKQTYNKDLVEKLVLSTATPASNTIN